MDELRLRRRVMLRLARDEVGREWLLELQPAKDRELLELVQMRLEASTLLIRPMSPSIWRVCVFCSFTLVDEI